MKHPPYHLRPNKAVDRFMFIESIRKLEKLHDLSEYTYYGLGGPYLEDFRLLYEFCPEINMVSIEKSQHTRERQKFHLPCATLSIKPGDFSSFLSNYQSAGKKSIFWMDYNEILNLSFFSEFTDLLCKVVENSMIKVTLPYRPSDYIDQPGESSKAEEFRTKFGALTTEEPTSNPEEFALILQGMARKVAEEALPLGETPNEALVFQPISSFWYSDMECKDSPYMFTMTGIVCRGGRINEIKEIFKSSKFNVEWKKPTKIDVPILSTKERLHLQKQLPCSGNAGEELLEALGYNIDENKEKTKAKLEQYATFHRHFPYFMKAVP